MKLFRCMLCSLGLLAGSAFGRERFQLSWTSDAASCPDQAALEAAIAARLGYPAFDPGAKGRVVAHVAERGAGLEGLLELYDAAGARQGKRVFDSPTKNCDALASSMELAISIAIDAMGASTLEAPVRPAPTAPPPPAVSPPAPPAPNEPVHFSAALLAAAELGLSPSPTGDFGLNVALRYRAFVIELEGWADVPTSASVRSGGIEVGSAQTNVLAGTLLACGVHRWLGVCATGTAAALQVSSEVSGQSARQTVVVPLAGARVLGSFEVGPVVLQLFAELDFVLNRVTLATGSTAVWVTPPVAARLGLSLGYPFF